MEEHGKIVKLDKNADALKFMEDIKIPKKDLWYMIVEKQKEEDVDTSLHMVKINEKGSDITQFVAELKLYYLKKFEEQEKLKSLIEKIKVKGNHKFSIIENIPSVKVGDKTLVSRITEDLVRLLRGDN